MNLDELIEMVENAPRVKYAEPKVFIYDNLAVSQKIAIVEWVNVISGNLDDIKDLRALWKHGLAFQVIETLTAQDIRIKARLLECIESQGFAQAESQLLELIKQ